MKESSGNGILSKVFSARVSPAFLLFVVLGFVATQFSQAQTSACFTTSAVQRTAAIPMQV